MGSGSCDGCEGARVCNVGEVVESAFALHSDAHQGTSRGANPGARAVTIMVQKSCGPLQGVAQQLRIETTSWVRLCAYVTMVCGVMWHVCATTHGITMYSHRIFFFQLLSKKL